MSAICMGLLLKRLGTPILLFQLLLGSSVFAQQTTRTMSPADTAAFKHALQLQDQGNGREAGPILKDLAGRYPNNFDVIEALGLLYAEAGELNTALPLLEKAATLSPRSSVAFANLGAAYLKVNRNQEAARTLERSAALDPGNMQTQSALGTALMSTRHPQQAAAAFAKAVEKNPADTDLRYNWAVALLDSGEVTKAAEALAPIPNQDQLPEVQSLLGDIAERRGQYKEAAEHLKTAATLDPSELNLYALGVEFLKHWTFEPAVKIFEFGTNRYPSSTRLLLGLGIAKYSMNDLTAAAPIFARLLDTDPENDMYADLLGRSCGLMPDSSQGCEKLEGFAEKHPKNATIATYAAASILHRSDHPEDLSVAEKLLDQAITLEPKLAEAHYQKGILEQYQSRWKDSIQELETAIALKPQYSKAHYRLALAYNHTGQRDKAQEEISLQKKYSEQEKDDLNARFKEVTTFLVAMH